MNLTKFLDAAAILNSQLIQPISIVGSLALAVRGISEVTPNDVDAIIAKGDFERLFGTEQQMRVCTSGKLRSYYSKLMVNDVQVELMACVEILIGNEWVPFVANCARQYLRHNRTILSFVNPQDLIDFYCALGRKKDFEKIRLINNHLAQKWYGDEHRFNSERYRSAANNVMRRLFKQCKID